MWSTVGSAFKLTLRFIPPVQMLLYASFVSIIVLFILLIVQKKLPILFSSGRKDLLYSALNALLNPFLFYIVLFYAYDLLLTQEAMVLNFTWPVTLTILSVFVLRQHIGWKSMAAILISFVGMVVIATRGDLLALRFTNPTGVALALGSTVIWSVFWIVNIRNPRDQTVKLFLNFFFGFFYIMTASLIMGPLVMPAWQAVAGTVYIGLFEMGIAYVFWLKGLQLSSTTARVSNLIFLAPFISLVIIHLTVGEPLLWSTLAGLVFITAGIVMQRTIKE